MPEITNEEIASVVEGSADQATQRRVTAAALLDPSVWDRLRRLQRAETASTTVAEDDGGFLLRAQRLKERMEIVARQVVRERRESYEATASPSRAGPIFGGPLGTLRRTLETIRHSVTLPGLAPAAAASAIGETQLRRDLFLVHGVRIELQQLPGESMRLRVFVDASGISEGFAAHDADGAALDIEGLGTLIVSLNAEGRGFADFIDLPAPRRSVALVGIALVRRSE